MAQELIDRALLRFWLYDWLDFEGLTARPHFSEHSRDTLEAAIDAAERLATERFLPHYKEADIHEPKLGPDGVTVLPALAEAVRAHVESGFVAAPLDGAVGGWQMPELAHAVLMSQFMAANVAAAGYSMLTIANARLLAAFGTPAQIEAFVRPQLAGEALGTMCLSEPQAGSSLGDIRTRAVPDGESALGQRFRITGNKMWISGGDHDITENVFHLVLAKIARPDGQFPAGTKGISLFVVPKLLTEIAGVRNDVVVAGLNHKMGYRGTTNCMLNFGEGSRFQPDGAAGAIGHLIGCEGQGIEIMFHMMNEARIAVGLGAAALGYRSHRLSLRYANERLQGRLQRDQPGQSPIVDHPDVRRMLLAQKCYAEGALALVLYAARLCDDKRTGEGAEQDDADALLGLLTPVCKTWSSEWGLAANDIAIQIHGGYGYTRDFDVEQLYRDNRLNPIHEGTTGIQGIDLVGRKIMRDQGHAVAVLGKRIHRTIEGAPPALSTYSVQLQSAWSEFETVVKDMVADVSAPWPLWHATELLSGFGHLIVGWMLLDQAALAERLSEQRDAGQRFSLERSHLCRFFFETELPRAQRSFAIFASRSDVAVNAPSGLFDF